VSDLPAQPSLRRMKAFGIRPKRDLGQNFLIDSNILDVIGRAAELTPDDVVLEIGGGLGVLSEYLAERVAHVHVVEVDRSLEPALRDALDPFGARATLWLADAMTLDLDALDPAPTKVVANLPYGIAAGAILRTIEQLPSVTRWVAMVQKEVGERFAARAGTAAYGVPSVLAQLACDVRVLRPISRQVFHPVPNVDSVLVGLERRDTAPSAASPVGSVAARAVPPVVPVGLRAFVQGAFAHRRKALARSVSLAGVADRDAVRAALEALGEPVDVRAERLSPERLRELWEAVERIGGSPATRSSADRPLADRPPPVPPEPRQ
jgi:16S rRNA (adenine1518-N6/adenine1519-N6)-dimethyltransferase